MSTLSSTIRDSATMLRRDLRHTQRYPMNTATVVLVPVIMLVLFDYFFGGALGGSLSGTAYGSYINYLAPGILVFGIASGCEVTAINLVMDMSEGIIARFRTMAIARSSVLTGQVLGSLLRTMLSILLLFGVALLLGFRPTTNPLAWLAALGLVVLFAFGVTWMGMVFGLIGKTPAGANSLSLLFTLLALTSSAFARTDTMPGAVRVYAEYQPFTPVINTVRGLLLGTPIGNNALLAVGWSVALALVGFLWARAVYNRGSVR